MSSLVKWLDERSDNPDHLMAWLLALTGFLPFAAIAAAMISVGASNPVLSLLADAFRTYGAVILSFLGGIRWGINLADPDSGRMIYAVSVVPALLAWTALFMPPTLGITLLLVTFCAQGAWDSVAFHRAGERIWFAKLRILLTLLVAAAHLLALLALA